jgi:hypothetical protein
MPWGYPPASHESHMPGPHRNVIPAAQPVTNSLEDWCSKHNLGNEERLGLIKLGFRVGDHNLVMLPAAEWEWAGLAPLHKQRILVAHNAEHRGDV